MSHMFPMHEYDTLLVPYRAPLVSKSYHRRIDWYEY
jgi:hypothetical protein